MKNSMRRAMISTVCMLIVAVMSLTGVTYAWFTAGTTATVSNIDVSVVEASGGLQLSKDGSTWASVLNLDTQEGRRFEPVSTAGNLSANNRMEFFHGTIDLENTSKVKSAATDSTDKYFEQDIYLKNDTGAPVTVNLTGTAIAENTGALASHYASRIALVIVDRSYDPDLVKDGLGESGEEATEDPYESTQKWIYEPYHNVHTARAKTLYSLADDAVQEYYGISAASDNTSFAWNAAGDYTTLMKDKVTYDPASVEFTVQNGEYVKVTLYVWLEGQDYDCENSVSGDTVTFNILFSKVD